jgi:hypothetical protein
VVGAAAHDLLPHGAAGIELVGLVEQGELQPALPDDGARVGLLGARDEAQQGGLAVAVAADDADAVARRDAERDAGQDGARGVGLADAAEVDEVAGDRPILCWASMTQLAFITQGKSQYTDRLWQLLEGTGIDPHEFEGLDYFGLVPFFVLAGASVRPQAHAHGDYVHTEGAFVDVEPELEEAFYSTLPEILAMAYGDEEDEPA